MSYKDLVGKSNCITRTIHFDNPKLFGTLNRVARLDEQAAEDIAELEKIVEGLKEYRRELAARYAELATMTYSDLLRIERRHSCWTNKITFEITIHRTFEDGTKDILKCEIFPGKERRTALARFEELKKQHPGIKTEKDLEKTYGEMNEDERDQWRAKREAENKA